MVPVDVYKRQDSYLMVCRGGGVWISKDGLSPYMQLTDKRVYPDVEGRFEDPVVWRLSLIHIYFVRGLVK